jgi:hypothetical protein
VESNNNKYLYIFLDEGGNFDFSRTGSKFFSLTSVTAVRKWDELYLKLSSEKYKLIEWGLNTEYFHCCEDNNHVKNKIFTLLAEEFKGNNIKIDSVLIEKSKTPSVLQVEKEFYSKMLGYLLKYIFRNSQAQSHDEIIVITDRIPINKKRQAVEKAVKKALARELDPLCKKYRLLHHSSASHYALQVADYCNWAILRKWERGEDKFYSMIKPFIRSEFEIFEHGKSYY